jgi:hypothetical protein
MAELLRLRVPRGWAVLDNKLFDTDPIVDNDGFITNSFVGFIEDVLWIQETELTENGYIVPRHNHFNIDIGWYPDSRIEGEYCATLSWCSTEEMIDVEKFISKNRFEVRDKIESWMNDLRENVEFHKAKSQSRSNNRDH